MKLATAKPAFASLIVCVMVAAALPQDQPAKKPQAPPVCQLVMFKLGPAWVKDKSVFEQPGIREHGAYMSKLIKEGTLLLGGPLFEDVKMSAANGAVMILAADTPEAARKILDIDPAHTSGLLEITEIRPLMITGASLRPPQKQ